MNRGNMSTLQMMSIILLIYVNYASGLKILVIPLAANSHVIMFSRLGAALINQGHSVTMVLPSDVKATIIDDRIELYRYKGRQSRREPTEAFLDIKFAKSIIEYGRVLANVTNILNNMTNTDVQNLVDDHVLRQTLTAKKLDLAIVDGVPLSTAANYAISLDLKYIMFGLNLHGLISGTPLLPSFCPSMLAGKYTDEMSFWERLHNSVIIIIFYSFSTGNSNTVDIANYTDVHVPDQGALMKKASFWFWLHEPALSFPVPHMPNTISIGDIMVTDTKPLPDKFQAFLDDAEEGVILLSMGSIIEFLPSDILDKFCAAFEVISQKVIWKNNAEPSCKVKLQHKMLVDSWIPQNDILAHRNTKLFITHCGFNGMLESLYHAKPMLGFPIAWDQFYNGKVLEKLQYGLTMDLADFTGYQLANNINAILNNDTISERILLGSKLIRDKPETPEKRVSYWVEYVAKYGVEHLRTGAYKLNIFQLFGIDVWFTLFVAILFLLVVLYIALLCACKYIKKCYSEKSKDKSD